MSSNCRGVDILISMDNVRKAPHCSHGTLFYLTLNYDQYKLTVKISFAAAPSLVLSRVQP